MTASASKVVALVPMFPSMGDAVEGLGEPYGNTTVLGHTLRRLAACEGLDQIVVLAPSGWDSPDRLDLGVQKKLEVVGCDLPTDQPWHRWRRSARRWSPTSWRGGLGGATCFDEVLWPAAMASAMASVDATAGLVVGADWPWVDPSLCGALVQRHRQETSLQLVFSQAPPGLGGCLISHALMQDLQRDGVMVASLLDYQPRRSMGDPIAKPNCLPIAPMVRDTPWRAVADAPRWRRVLGVIETLAEDASTETLVCAVHTQLAEAHRTPWHVQLELTTDRRANGPITPKHHVSLARGPMKVSDAQTMFQALGEAEPDVVLTVGGLGDPLLHDQWDTVIQEAHAAGICGIHLETDLLEGSAIDRLVALPLDTISVRINAASESTYTSLMGLDAFSQVIENVQTLIQKRSDRTPWILPRLIKHPQNIGDLGGFLDQWTLVTGHAVIEGPTDGCGLAPPPAVLTLAPPRRRPCRQLRDRMSVLADGRVALCDQDWLGTHPTPSAVEDPVAAWQALDPVRQSHAAGRFEPEALCGQCRCWHRP